MKGKKNLKKILIISGVALVVFLAVAKRMGVIGQNEELRVAVEQVVQRTITEIVSANGKIQPAVEVKVSPDVSGEVVELMVKEGDKVTKGQYLAKIDPKIYQSTVEQVEANLYTNQARLSSARAQLAQSRARYINEELNYKRSQQLFEKEAISPAEFDKAKATFDIAAAEVEASQESVKAAQFTVNSMEASVKEAREKLFKTAIYAPLDGIVSKLNVEMGERVAGASQFGSGTEFMRIANMHDMEVNVDVSENDIIRVENKDTCLIEVDAYLNKKFRGVVTEIATSAQSDIRTADQITNFQVKIRILPSSYSDLQEGEGGESPFRPGMSANVDIQTHTAKDVLTVPIQAVTTRSDTASSGSRLHRSKTKNDDKDEDKAEDEVEEYLFVYDAGKVQIKSVTTGVQDAQYIEIIEGVALDQEVVTAPYRAVSKLLKSGSEVKKVPREELYEKD